MPEEKLDEKLIEEEQEKNKSLFIFGRDVSEIPCFRSSFLYGIGGGVGAGTLAFLGTSRTQLSTHVGFGTFCAGTFFYWFYCRYEWSKKRFEYSQLKSAMKQKALYEGTAVEKEIEKLEEC